MKKGILSPIDFAIAFAVVFAVITFTAFYITGWSSSQVSIGRAADIETASKEIGKTLFETQGIPSDWETSSEVRVRYGLASYAYQIPVIVKEATKFKWEVGEHYGASHINEVIEIPIDFSHEAKSVRVYDEQMNEVPSELVLQTEQNKTRFQINLAPGERKTYYIFYSSVYFEPEWGWTSANATGTIETQILQETEIKIISYQKLKTLSMTNYKEKSKMTDYDFRIEIADFSWGPDLPEGADMAIYSAPLLVQDSSGRLEPKTGKVIVW